MSAQRRRSVTKANFQTDAARLSGLNNVLVVNRGEHSDHEAPHKPRDSLKTMFAHFNVHLAKTNIPEEGTNIAQTTPQNFVATEINFPSHTLGVSANPPRVGERRASQSQVSRATNHTGTNSEDPKSFAQSHCAPRQRPVTVEEELQFKLSKMACVCNLWKQRWQAEHDEKLTLLDKIKKTEEKCLQLIEDLNSSYSQQLEVERQQNVQTGNKIEELLEEKYALVQRTEFLSKHIEQLNDVIDAKTKTSESLSTENQQLRESLEKARMTELTTESSFDGVNNTDHYKTLYEIALLKLHVYEKSQVKQNTREDCVRSQLYTVTSVSGRPTDMAIQLVGNLQTTDSNGGYVEMKSDTEKDDGIVLRSPLVRVRKPKRRASSESESVRHSSPEAWQLRRIALTTGSSLYHSDELDDSSSVLAKQTKYGSCSSLQSFSGSDISDTSQGQTHRQVKRYHSDAGECVSDNEVADSRNSGTLQDSNFAGLRSRRNGIYAIPMDVHFAKSKKNSSKELSEFLLRKLTMKKTGTNEDEKPVKKLKDKLKIKVGKNVRNGSTP